MSECTSVPSTPSLSKGVHASPAGTVQLLETLQTMLRRGADSHALQSWVHHQLEDVAAAATEAVGDGAAPNEAASAVLPPPPLAAAAPTDASPPSNTHMQSPAGMTAPFTAMHTRNKNTNGSNNNNNNNNNSYFGSVAHAASTDNANSTLPLPPRRELSFSLTAPMDNTTPARQNGLTPVGAACSAPTVAVADAGSPSSPLIPSLPPYARVRPSASSLSPMGTPPPIAPAPPSHPTQRAVAILGYSPRPSPRTDSPTAMLSPSLPAPLPTPLQQQQQPPFSNTSPPPIGKPRGYKGKAPSTLTGGSNAGSGLSGAGSSAGRPPVHRALRDITARDLTELEVALRSNYSRTADIYTLRRPNNNNNNSTTVNTTAPTAGSPPSSMMASVPLVQIISVPPVASSPQDGPADPEQAAAAAVAAEARELQELQEQQTNAAPACREERFQTATWNDVMQARPASASGSSSITLQSTGQQPTPTSAFTLVQYAVRQSPPQRHPPQPTTATGTSTSNTNGTISNNNNNNNGNPAAGWQYVASTPLDPNLRQQFSFQNSLSGTSQTYNNNNNNNNNGSSIMGRAPPEMLSCSNNGSGFGSLTSDVRQSQAQQANARRQSSSSFNISTTSALPQQQHRPNCHANNVSFNASNASLPTLEAGNQSRGGGSISPSLGRQSAPPAMDNYRNVLLDVCNGAATSVSATSTLGGADGNYYRYMPPFPSSYLARKVEEDGEEKAAGELKKEALLFVRDLVFARHSPVCLPRRKTKQYLAELGVPYVDMIDELVEREAPAADGPGSGDQGSFGETAVRGFDLFRVVALLEDLQAEKEAAEGQSSKQQGNTKKKKSLPPLLFTTVVLNVMCRYAFVDAFGFNLQRLYALLECCERQFFQEGNPYHNLAHAADVVIAAHQFVQHMDVAANLTDEELFSFLFASVVMHVGHTGLHNKCLLQYDHPFVGIGGHRSPQQGTTLALIFALMDQKEYKFLPDIAYSVQAQQQQQQRTVHAKCDAVQRVPWTQSRYTQCVEMITELVFATDERNNRSALTEFESVLLRHHQQHGCHCRPLWPPQALTPSPPRGEAAAEMGMGGDVNNKEEEARLQPQPSEGGRGAHRSSNAIELGPQKEAVCARCCTYIADADLPSFLKVMLCFLNFSHLYRTYAVFTLGCYAHLAEVYRENAFHEQWVAQRQAAEQQQLLQQSLDENPSELFPSGSHHAHHDRNNEADDETQDGAVLVNGVLDPHVLAADEKTRTPTSISAATPHHTQQPLPLQAHKESHINSEDSNNNNNNNASAASESALNLSHSHSPTSVSADGGSTLPSTIQERSADRNIHRYYNAAAATMEEVARRAPATVPWRGDAWTDAQATAAAAPSPVPARTLVPAAPVRDVMTSDRTYSVDEDLLGDRLPVFYVPADAAAADRDIPPPLSSGTVRYRQASTSPSNNTNNHNNNNNDSVSCSSNSTLRTVAAVDHSASTSHVGSSHPSRHPLEPFSSQPRSRAAAAAQEEEHVRVGEEGESDAAADATSDDDDEELPTAHSLQGSGRDVLLVALGNLYLPFLNTVATFLPSCWSQSARENYFYLTQVRLPSAAAVDQMIELVLTNRAPPVEEGYDDEERSHRSSNEDGEEADGRPTPRRATAEGPLPRPHHRHHQTREDEQEAEEGTTRAFPRSALRRIHMMHQHYPAKAQWRFNRNHFEERIIQQIIARTQRCFQH